MLAAVLAGCSAGPPPNEELGELGRELVPAGSEIVDTSEGACVQLAGNPSCARVYFTTDLPLERRADGLERAAQAAGWEVVSREPRRDGILIELGRDGYRAFAAIWEDARAAPCRDAPDKSCADELQVIEDTER